MHRRRYLAATAPMLLAGCLRLSSEEEGESTGGTDDTAGNGGDQNGDENGGNADSTDISTDSPEIVPDNSWAMERGTPANTGITTESAVPSNGISTAWSVDLDSAASSTISVGNDLAVLGTQDGTVLALDPETGDERWRFETTGEINGTPAITNGHVFVGSKGSRLYAIAADTGDEVWEFRGEDDRIGPPTVANGTVFVNSGRCFALDPETGDQLWKSAIETRSLSNPCVDKFRVYCATITGTVAIDRSEGTTVWQQETSEPPWDLSVEGDVAYTGDRGNTLSAMEATSGTVQWEFGTEGTAEAPTLTPDRVFCGANEGGLVVLDHEGAAQWDFVPEDGGVQAAPVTDGSLAVVATDVGEVYGIEVASGTVQWNSSVNGGVLGTPALANDRIYLATSNTVAALE